LEPRGRKKKLQNLPRLNGCTLLDCLLFEKETGDWILFLHGMAQSPSPLPPKKPQIRALNFTNLSICFLGFLFSDYCFLPENSLAGEMFDPIKSYI